MQTGFLSGIAAILFATVIFESRSEELVWGVDGEGFQLAIAFEKTTFQKGEPIFATVVVKNASRGVRYLIGSLPPSPHREYSFTVIRDGSQLLSAISPLPTMSRGQQTRMEADMIVTNRFQIDSLFDLSEPGNYVITATLAIAPVSISQNPYPLMAATNRIQSGSAIISVAADVGQTASDRSPFMISNVEVVGTTGRSSNSLNNYSGNGTSSPDISKSTTMVATPLASAPPFSETGPPSSGQRAGIAVIVGLSGLLLAILWRAARRKPEP
jgi:hypothetical protein